MSLFRSTPTRIYYGPNRSTAYFDELVVATAVAAAMVGVAWIIVWPTAKRVRETIVMHGAHALAVFVFVVPILGLVCKSWQSGSLSTSTPYCAFNSRDINATVGLYVGLGSFNVTLLGDPEFQSVGMGGGGNRSVADSSSSAAATSSAAAAETEEQINYNENVEFGARQGRVGFGEYGNAVTREYRRLQARGVPYPIAWVMELFTNDGDGMRWGRNYRAAGYFAAVCLWSSVVMWALTLITLAAGVWGLSASFNEERDGNAAHAAHASPSGTTNEGGTLRRSFLLRSQLRPASILCACTGLLQLCAPLIYVAILRASVGSPVAIEFTSGTLELSFGWCFWLLLCTGFCVLILGLSGAIWSSYGYASRVRELEFVWEDVAEERVYRAQQQQLHHRRAHSNSSGAPGMRHPHHDRRQGSGGGGGGGGVGGSMSSSFKSPESNAMGAAAGASPSVLELTVIPNEPMQQQQQPQLTHSFDPNPVQFHLAPSSSAAAAPVGSSSSSSSTLSVPQQAPTPTSGMRPSFALAQARHGLEAIPDLSDEAEMASAAPTPSAAASGLTQRAGVEEGAAAAGTPAAAAAAAGLNSQSHRSLHPPPAAHTLPALQASTPSALPLYSGPALIMLDTARAGDSTTAATAAGGSGPQHFVYGRAATEAAQTPKQ